MRLLLCLLFHRRFHRKLADDRTVIRVSKVVCSRCGLQHTKASLV